MVDRWNGSDAETRNQALKLLPVDRLLVFDFTLLSRLPLLVLLGGQTLSLCQRRLGLVPGDFFLMTGNYLCLPRSPPYEDAHRAATNYRGQQEHYQHAQGNGRDRSPASGVLLKLADVLQRAFSFGVVYCCLSELAGSNVRFYKLLRQAAKALAPAKMSCGVLLKIPMSGHFFERSA
jgi:hypothetical protein